MIADILSPPCLFAPLHIAFSAKDVRQARAGDPAHLRRALRGGVAAHQRHCEAHRHHPILPFDRDDEEIVALHHATYYATPYNRSVRPIREVINSLSLSLYIYIYIYIYIFGGSTQAEAYF